MFPKNTQQYAWHEMKQYTIFRPTLRWSGCNSTATANGRRHMKSEGQTLAAGRSGRRKAVEPLLSKVICSPWPVLGLGSEPRALSATDRLSIALRCLAFLSRSCLASPAISAGLLPHVHLQRRVARYNWFRSISLFYFISHSHTHLGLMCKLNREITF